MQMGEPAAGGAGGGSAQRKEWEGLVIEINFQTDITSARDRSAIAGPHWKEGEDPTDTWPLASTLGLGSGPFSKKAATYKVKAAGGPRTVEVKVRVTKCVNVSGTGTLRGIIGSLEIEGSCPLAAGEHTVSAQIKELPEKITYFHGLLNWRMEASDIGQVAMNGTLVELFFVLAQPDRAYTPGVWVEALRIVCLRGPVTGLGKDEDVRAVANITRYCHTHHGMRYDCYIGASHFGVRWSGGTFELWNYIHKTGLIVNCYDQAAAVQSLSGCLGIRSTWISLESYGFIRETDLVGWGMCNNPFFKGDTAVQRIGQNDAARTAFNHHTLIEHGAVGSSLGAAIGVGAVGGTLGGGIGGAVEGGGVGALSGPQAGGVVGPLVGATVALKAEGGGYMLDACAGPHMGTESRSQYVAAAIDTTTTLYGSLRRPGTVADMVACPGVKAIQ